MKKNITVYDNEGRAGTKIIADGFGRRHEQVVRLIKKYQSEFEKISTLKVLKSKTKGRPYEEYLLDEDQFMFLGTLFKNNEQTVKFKARIIQEFKQCRKRLAKALNQKHDPAWSQARLTGKTLRLFETDAIQEFIIYAKKQGGSAEGCNRYYSNFTRMTNTLLFICESKFKNVRDVLSPTQLFAVGVVEQIIGKSLREDMQNEVYYKTIYKNAKEKVKLFVELHGKSAVISKQLNLLEE